MILRFLTLWLILCATSSPAFAQAPNSPVLRPPRQYCFDVGLSWQIPKGWSYVAGKGRLPYGDFNGGEGFVDIDARVQGTLEELMTELMATDLKYCPDLIATAPQKVDGDVVVGSNCPSKNLVMKDRYFTLDGRQAVIRCASVRRIGEWCEEVRASVRTEVRQPDAWFNLDVPTDWTSQNIQMGKAWNSESISLELRAHDWEDDLDSFVAIYLERMFMSDVWYDLVSRTDSGFTPEWRVFTFWERTQLSGEERKQLEETLAKTMSVQDAKAEGIRLRKLGHRAAQRVYFVKAPKRFAVVALTCRAEQLQELDVCDKIALSFRSTL
ncbi:MAG: hypothetical protein R3E66_06355 [bacterium]